MAGKDQVLTTGDLRLDLETRQVQNGRAEPVRLTRQEARLLATFMRHPGLTLSRRFLMREVWETDYVGDTRTLKVHVCWLRRKIGRDRLETIRGEGYRFVAAGDAEQGTV